MGTETPKVLVDSNERPLKSSSEFRIVAGLPLTGAGSSGDVVVEFRGMRNNARQLSESKVPHKYTFALDPPQLKR